MAIKIQGTTVISDERIVCANTVCANTFVGDGANLTGILYNDIGRVHYFAETPPSSCGYLATDNEVYKSCDYPNLASCLCNHMTFDNVDIPSSLRFGLIQEGFPHCCRSAGTYYPNLYFFAENRCPVSITSGCCVLPRSCANDFLKILNVNDMGGYTGTFKMFMYNSCNCCNYSAFVTPFCFHPDSNSTHFIVPTYAFCGDQSCWRILSGQKNQGGYSDSLGDDANTCFTTKHISWFPGRSGFNIGGNNTIGVIRLAFNTSSETFCCCGCVWRASCDCHFANTFTCGWSYNRGCIGPMVAAGTIRPSDGCLTHVAAVQIDCCYLCLGGIVTFPTLVVTSGFNSASAAPRVICCSYSNWYCLGHQGAIENAEGKQISIGNTNMVTAGACGWAVMEFANGAPSTLTCYSCCTCTLNSIIYDHDNKRYIAFRNNGGLFYSANGDTWTLGQCTLCCVCNLYRAGPNKIVAINQCITFITCDGGCTWSSAIANATFGTVIYPGASGACMCQRPSITSNLQCLVWNSQCQSTIRICDLNTTYRPCICNIHYDCQTCSYIGVTNCGLILCSNNIFDTGCWVCKSCLNCPSAQPVFFSDQCRIVFGLHQCNANLTYRYASFDSLETICCNTSCILKCPFLEESQSGTASNEVCAGQALQIPDCRYGYYGVITYNGTCNTHQDFLVTCDKGVTWKTLQRNVGYNEWSFCTVFGCFCAAGSQYCNILNESFVTRYTPCGGTNAVPLAFDCQSMFKAWWDLDQLKYCFYRVCLPWQDKFYYANGNCESNDLGQIGSVRYYNRCLGIVTAAPGCSAKQGLISAVNSAPGIEDPVNRNVYLIISAGATCTGYSPPLFWAECGCVFTTTTWLMDTETTKCRYFYSQSSPSGFGKVVNNIFTIAGIPLQTCYNNSTTFSVPCYEKGYIKT